MPLTREQFEKTLSEVNGWLTLNEGWALYEAAKKCSRGVIIEVGTHQGRSTTALALGSQDGSHVKVYTIDHHVYNPEYPETLDAHQHFVENIEKNSLQDLVQHYCMTSKEAASKILEPAELLFIDASHDYENAMFDFNSWSSLLIDGGTVAFHDYGCWGPTSFPGLVKAVDELKSKLAVSHMVDSTIFLIQNEMKHVIESGRNGCLCL